MNRLIKVKTLVYLIGLSVLWMNTSCVSSKKIVYFQEMEGVAINDSIQQYEPQLQRGDILKIVVSTVDPEAAIPFNLYETPMVGTTMSNAKPLSYLVDSDGAINFPVLGTLKVAGLTTKELTLDLEKKLSDYIKKPTIYIRLENFKVSVLGEVKSPGAISVLNERITILEAISMAGDLNIQGERANITLIREQEGSRVFIPIDLTSRELFNSPYFYLAQNDVLYVQPNKARINSSMVGPNTSIVISAISTLISIIAIVTR
ncbi:polysaccharide biosynthesis/export family protein [Lutibacter sp. TH_r2]|uniref:polysaccharide biosynthesis/export family protein n=1 Tax=Lutibacter sp. TH_r2 TaxID=3082083 RepID=UPI002955A84B|nr:polysaccharide biosynthesis/export family protein [Lutibacter sp. TH_r2]MDV7187781.1 polysaccharide biosynthesis/export family protein [Lutibacter sp. TH_r2]